MTEYVVNLHVHTTYSDGTGSIQEVLKAAQRAGLDALLITDHDTMAARYDGTEGYHGGLLVVVGMEFSGAHNHYLAFGLKDCPKYVWVDPQGFIDATRKSGGVGFVAHPFEKGSPMYENGRAYTWKDWGVKGFDGLEIWNFSSAWKMLARDWRSAIFHYFFRTGTLPGPDPETLAKWDALGRTRRTAGVAGSDAHATVVRLLGLFKLKVFPYEKLFRGVNTHVLLPAPLTGRAEEDRAAVLEALAHGSCFAAHDRLHSGKGFDFWLENDSRRRTGQGGEATAAEGDCLAWVLPKRSPARLIKDGRVVLEITADRGRMAVDAPGVYRLEVDHPTRLFGPRPWIFSNPVYIRE